MSDREFNDFKRSHEGLDPFEAAWTYWIRARQAEAKARALSKELEALRKRSDRLEARFRAELSENSWPDPPWTDPVLMAPYEMAPYEDQDK